MLPAAYTLRGNGTEAEYDADLANRAIRTFWKELPNGREDHVEGLRRMHDFLYQQALAGTGSEIFLDKTPRYYLILPELYEIFPQARFILLVRNPLAVLSSILRTWIGEQWLQLANFKADLVEGPNRILQANEQLGDSATLIRYEDLVQEPENEIARLCTHVGIDFDPAIVKYGERDTESWEYGDPESVYEHTEPQTSSIEKWAEPDNAQQWRLLYEYGKRLGNHVFERVGSDLDSCLQKLETVRPSERELRYTVSLDWLLRTESDERTRSERHGLNLMQAMRDGGVTGAFRYVAGRAQDRLP